MSVVHTLRHFEWGFPYFPDLDINVLMGAFAKFEWIVAKTKEQADAKAIAEQQGLPFESEPVDPGIIVQTFSEILVVLAKAGKLHVIRSLAAIANATEEELQEAETNPKKWEDLQNAAARLPVKAAIETALGFHMELLSSLGGSVDSSDSQKAVPAKAAKSAKPVKGASRSAG